MLLQVKGEVSGSMILQSVGKKFNFLHQFLQGTILHRVCHHKEEGKVCFLDTFYNKRK